MLRDHVRLIPKLYECARKAGVQKNCREMHHFSRWAFLIARQAGAAGLTDGAANCFKVAISVAFTKDLTMRIVGSIARVVGWKVTGKLCMFRDIIS